MNLSSNFSRRLKIWYGANARELPWRKTSDPYKIWVSEIMLQQTTVNAVVPYYRRWVKNFPTIHSVARSPLEKILKEWQGLGYYQRAKNLHASAKIIARDFGGKIPKDAAILKTLPGFGAYTIGAVLSIAFDQRAPIIDANVRRVIMRQLKLEGNADTKKDPLILAYLEKVMPRKGNNIFNQALMELGALICRNREPLCNQCPIKKSCRAYAKGVQELIPTPKVRTIKNIEASVAVIEKNGQYFVQKRPKTGLLADLWEFPGGKVKQGESPRNALKRELKEEIGCSVDKSRHLFNVQHFYTQYRVNLHVWECTVLSDPKVDKFHRWVHLRDLKKLPMPSGSARILDRLSNNSLDKV